MNIKRQHGSKITKSNSSQWNFYLPKLCEALRFLNKPKQSYKFNMYLYCTQQELFTEQISELYRTESLLLQNLFCVEPIFKIGTYVSLLWNVEISRYGYITSLTNVFQGVWLKHSITPIFQNAHQWLPSKLTGKQKTQIPKEFTEIRLE